MANTDYGAIPLTLATATSQKLNQKLGVTTGFKPSEWADAINLLGRLPVKTASGSIAHFDDGVDNVPLKSYKFGISAVQSGTGTPSPSNVRPISGWNKVTVTQTGADTSVPVHTFEIPLGDTIYGGWVDEQGNGEVTWLCIQPTSVGSVSTSGGKYYWVISIADNLGITGGSIISSHFKGVSGSVIEGNCYVTSYGKLIVAVPTDQTLNTKALADAWLAENKPQFCYILATPIPFTLSSMPVINSLNGTNNIWADSGDSQVRYMASSASTTIGFSSECTGSWSSTDDERTFLTVTASDKTTVNFGTGMTGYTNCGSNDGYFAVYKNSTQVFKKVITTGSTLALGSIPSVNLDEGDVLTFRFGFANNHSNIKFNLYNGIVDVGGVASVTGIVGVSNTNTNLIGITT